MRKGTILFSAILMLFAGPVLAQTSTTDGVLDIVTQAMSDSASSIIAPKVMGWLGVFLTLQFVLSNTKSLLSSDLQEALVKGFGAFVSAGMCILLLTYGPQLIDSIGNSLLGEFLASVPSASSILASTLSLGAALLAAAGFASALNDALASIIVTCFWLVLASGAYLACRVFMFYLELGMILLISPVSFALFGLSTFKEQGLAPIKGVISLLYRALLFGCIFGAYKYVNDSLADVINNTSWINITTLPSNITKLISGLLAYPVLLFLAFKSDSIAASLASGSSSMGTGDIAQAAAAGAAAGSVAAAAGSATANAAGGAPQSMADFMSSMSGGGSIKNAGGMGGGGASPATFTPPASPSMSRSSGIGASNSGTAVPASSSTTNLGKPAASPARSVASGRYGDSPSSASKSGTAQPASNPITSNQHGDGAGNAAKGSAETASIGGAGPVSQSLEQSLAQIAQNLGNQGSRKPTFAERMGEANRQLAQEHSATHIAMNAHHQD